MTATKLAARFCHIPVAPHVDHPDRIRTHPARRLGNGRMLHSETVDVMRITVWVLRIGHARS
ncbi:hypothetical protein [Streptosporangium sp. 'caverna']|uniref:hypothetical protein n=1 Tax=Streptosporangium sp. 'caverna' TaxID=2202249 RepID=UPI00195517DB|nr:hypothetical protein [Streptosporangium sp. 'caverna']